MVQRELNLVLAWRAKKYVLYTKNTEMEALLSKQNSPFCSASRENPFLHPNPYLRRAEGIDATLQGLAKAAIGLLHALHLGRSGNEGTSNSAREAVNTSLCQGPTSADTVPLPNTALCHPPSNSFTPHNHSVGETLWFTPFHRPVFLFF